MFSAAIALSGGLVDLTDRPAFDWRAWLPVAAVAVVVPALAEEWVFRGVLPELGQALIRPSRPDASHRAPQDEVNSLDTPTRPHPEVLAQRASKDGPGLAADALALLAFIAWHPLQVGLGLPYAQVVFLRPDFLLIAALLGLACTISYRRSGSLQPAILMHWAVVAGWKALTG